MHVRLIEVHMLVQLSGCRPSGSTRRSGDRIQLFLLVAALILCGLSGCVGGTGSTLTPTPADVLAPMPTVEAPASSTILTPSPTLETLSSPTILSPSPMAAKSTYTPGILPTEAPTPSSSPVNVLAPSPTAETPAPPTTAPATATSQVGTETDPVPAEETLSIPLGIGIWDADNVTVFNRYAREQDVIAARTPFLDLLGDVEIGQKMVFLAPGDEAGTDIRSTIAEAKTKGVTMLGYNLETALPEEDLVYKEKEMQRVARAHGLVYAFAPTLLKLTKYYDDFVRYADIVILQSQRFQTKKGYEERVEELITAIRSANPRVKVWVQVSVNPPEDRHVTPDEVVSDIQRIADQADLIWIYFTPKRASVMEEVFKRLRQPGGPDKE